jgi:hypothetical protein
MEKYNIREEVTYRLVKLLIDLDVIKPKPRFLYLRDFIIGQAISPRYNTVIKNIGHYEF